MQDKVDIDTWGLDVFSASRAIRDSRVLTATTFKIFQERGLCHTFKIDQRTLLTFLMTIEDHYLKVSGSYLLFVPSQVSFAAECPLPQPPARG